MLAGDTLWTHNDSGGAPSLFGLDPETGNVLQICPVDGARNRDWEALAADDHHVYVGDLGNNAGVRDTVEILILRRPEPGDPEPCFQWEGSIQVIHSKPLETNGKGWSNRDCEALLAWEDSLYLFSKDWVHRTTDVYVLPATPGTYVAEAARSYRIDFLVTGADLSETRREVVLVGYKHYAPVVAVYRFGATPADLACGGRARVYPGKWGRQVEGIAYRNDTSCYVSSEKALHNQSLFLLHLAPAPAPGPAPLR
ncbi:MAG: hypothetical protein R2751_05390 [Bacteroidales bacterium]